jgi:Las1-like.
MNNHQSKANTSNNSNGQQLGNSQVKFPLTFKHNLKKRTARLTPWSCPDEFDYVGHCFAHATCLFSSPATTSCSSGSTSTAATASSLSAVKKDNNGGGIMMATTSSTNTLEPVGELQYAIQRVFLWKNRAENGRLPHSVEITCSLAQILLQDAMLHGVFNRQSSISSGDAFQLYHQHTIKLSYATVIIRGVNGIADSLQKNRAKFGGSVSSLCSQIGLPLWIVDLRHDSAHNELPSLVSLRLAAQTLLGFFLQHYWTVVEDFKRNWRVQAESLLKECKSSCKELDRLLCHDLEQAQSVMNTNNNTSMMQQGDDRDREQGLLGSGSGVGGDGGEYYGMYSILMESNQKKQQPQQKSVKSKASSSLSSSSEKGVRIRDRMHGRTPRQCLQDYIENIPIDVGIEMLLQYLFHGGISDAPQGRGILIPGSPTTFPETINSARKMRERYSVILIYITEHWPGFLHAALVTIADMIILLEGEQKSTCRDGSNDSHRDDDSCCDLGSNRKLFFLKHWFLYLLSNEFYCFLQWVDVTWKGSKNIRERPREKWSEELILYLESNAPRDALKQARLPLHGIYKRFISEGDGSISHELATILETVLGEECKMSQICGLNPDSATSIPSPMGTACSESLHDSSRFNSWASCSIWEPCAIGTLPGHIRNMS